MPTSPREPCTHMFWACPRLTDFWSNTFKTLTQALNTTITPNVLTALFGLPLDQNLPVTIKHVIAFATLLARCIILQKWKHTSPLTHDRWIKEILECIKLEKLRYSLKGSLATFCKTWILLLNYINSLTISPESIGA